MATESSIFSKTGMLRRPGSTVCCAAFSVDIVFLDRVYGFILGPGRLVVKYRFAQFGGVIWISTISNQEIHEFSIAVLYRTMQGSVVNLAF